MDMASKNPDSLTVLGIETSCDETAAAVVRRHADGRGEVLGDVVLSQTAEHAAFGGVVPEIAARAHLHYLDGLIGQAMEEAGLDYSQLDGVAATAGPGLMGGLLVGLMSAKAIALAKKLPFIAVNHLEGHGLSPGLMEGLAPPYLLLLMSGGHTQIVSVEDVGRFARYGTTIDDALGEAFDKVAKMLNLGYPGGPVVEKLARRGDAERFALPRPMKGRAGCHFSFSGLKTAVRTTAMKLENVTEADKADICASFQKAVAETLADRLDHACARFMAEHPGLEKPVLVAAGGVAANAALRKAIEDAVARHGFRLTAPPAHMCTDNAAMIAWAGAERLARGMSDPLSTPARARWPLDPDAEPAAFAGVKA